MVKELYVQVYINDVMEFFMYMFLGRGTKLLIISFSYAEVLFKKDEHWRKQKLFCDYFSFVCFFKHIYIWVVGEKVFLAEFHHLFSQEKR